MSKKQDISKLPIQNPQPGNVQQPPGQQPPDQPPVKKSSSPFRWLLIGILLIVVYAICRVFIQTQGETTPTPTAVAQQEAVPPTEEPAEGDPPTPTTEPTEEPEEEGTATPRPTVTSVPTRSATDTPQPTETPLPPTDTPEPTATLAPTDTPITIPPTSTPAPLPTDTPLPLPPTNTPVPVPPTDTPAPPPPVQVGLPKDSAIGVQKQVGIWAMKLYQVKKAKAVYYFGDPDVAEGVYLMPFVEFTNTGSGSKAPVEDLDFFIVDGMANRYDLGFSDGDLGAAHQFQAGHIWDDMDPGAVLGIVIPGDVPEGITDAWLKVDQDPNFIMYLGDASTLPLE